MGKFKEFFESAQMGAGLVFGAIAMIGAMSFIKSLFE